MDSNRYTVLKGRFGMGNRIAVVLSALAYSEATGRQLVVDWNDHTYYNPGVPDVFSALWEWPTANQTPLEDLSGLSVFPSEWQGRLTDYRNEINAEIMPYAFAWSRPPDELSPEMAEIAQEHDAVVVTRDGDRRRFREMYRGLVPRPFIRSRVALLQEGHDWDRMIGVQIRHGNGERYVTPADTGWFHDRIAELRNEDPGLGVFLATDSITVVSEFADRYADLVRAPQWFPEPGSGSMHHHPDCPSRFEHGVASLVDMWMLKDCAYLLLCAGGFGATVEQITTVSQDRIQKYPGKIHATVEEKRDWDNPI